MKYEHDQDVQIRKWAKFLVRFLADASVRVTVGVRTKSTGFGF